MRPIGEQRESPIDVRILSATHKNLVELVAQARFREDLFYRINVIELRVPALRERAEDIPDLADAIVRRLARRLGIDPPEISPEAIDVLQHFAFPATCANWRTSSSARSPSATTGASMWATCSCAPCRESRTLRRCPPITSRNCAPAARRTLPVRPPNRRTDPRSASSSKTRARGDRQGARGSALQQDGGSEGARHDLSRAAVSHQEARNRVTLCDAQRHFVTL